MKLFVSCKGAFAVSLVFALSSVFVAGSVYGAGITVDNLKDGEKISYQLALLQGRAGDGGGCVTVTGGGTSRDWPVVGGKYKALVMLEKGRNEILLDAPGETTKTFTVNYAPKWLGQSVRIVYVLASDSDGCFQAPAGEPCDIESAKKRLSFAALLMQTATAELMHDAGYGRKTFRLCRTRSGEVDTKVYRSKLSMAKVRGMTGLEMWRKLRVELNRLGGGCRNLAVMQMTRYDKSAGKAYGHTALGGDTLALMGSGSLHTWAEGLDELVERFSDERRVVSYGLFDDSAYRKTFWANYATSLGACLHELGHAFGLTHSGDRNGIMQRGFDRINRLFMLTDGTRPYNNEDIRWAPKSARILSDGVWLN